MAYDSIVCVKQVPDTANITAEAMKEDGTVNRAALPAIFNPEDLHALETALEVRDRVRRHGHGHHAWARPRRPTCSATACSAGPIGRSC